MKQIDIELQIAKEHDCEIVSNCYDYIDNKVQKLRKKLKRKVCLNRKKVEQEINALGCFVSTFSVVVSCATVSFETPSLATSSPNS